MAGLAYVGHIPPSELGFDVLEEDVAIKLAKQVDKLRKSDQELWADLILTAVKTIVSAIYKAAPR